MSGGKDRLDEALEGLNNWYEQALAAGGGFKSDAERQAYVESLGDLEKHPMFARTAEDLEGHPLAEAIRQIKEEDQSLVELAIMYKDEGNEWQKKKDKKSLNEAYDRYTHSLGYVHKAELARTNGQEDPKDVTVDLLQLRSQILSNRAAVSLTLQNYGSCKRDCNLAIDSWSGNVKAHYRKCKALFALKDYAACELACLAALQVDTDNKEIQDIHRKAQEERQTIYNRTIRVWDAKYQELRSQWIKVWKLCQQVQASLGYFQLFNPEPLQLREQWPYREGEDIYWPVLFLYPQYNQFDVVPEANIDQMLAEQLAMMFPDHTEAPPAPWDKDKEYELPNLVVYLQVRQTERVGSLEEWLTSCIENYVKVQSGSFDIAKYALQQLGNGQKRHGKFGELDALTVERFGEIVDQDQRERAARLHALALEEERMLHGPSHIYEVHMGCNMRRIITHAAETNALPRGVLSLVVFPRGNAAHKKFLKAIKADNRNIEILNPI